MRFDDFLTTVVLALVAVMVALGFSMGQARASEPVRVDVDALMAFVASKDPELFAAACSRSMECRYPPIRVDYLAPPAGGLTIFPLNGAKLEIIVSSLAVDTIKDGETPEMYQTRIEATVVHELTHYFQVLAYRYYKGKPVPICETMGAEIDAYAMERAYIQSKGFDIRFKVHPVDALVFQCKLTLR